MISKLVAKLKNKHFLSLAANGSMTVFSMITVGLLYRSLTAIDNGLWIFFQSAYVLLDTFRTGFLQTAIIKFYSGAEDNRANEVMGSTWFLGSAITTFFLALSIPAWFILPYIHISGIQIIIKWFAVTFLFSLPNCLAFWSLQAKQQFDKLLYIRIINQGSFIIFIVIFLFTEKLNLETTLLSNLIGCLITSLVCLFFGWTEIKSFSKRSKTCIKELFNFGKYSVGTTIGANLLRSSDTFIINFTLGPAALAVYNLATRLLEIIEFPLRSFLATGMPALSNAFNQNKRSEVANILKKYAGLLTISLIPVSIVAIILADVGIGLLGGGKYTHTEAANIYRILMLFAIFYPIERFMGITIDIVNQPKMNLLKIFLMLTVNVIGDFIGIYFFGNIYGIALASLLPILVGMIFGFWILRKHLDFSILGILSTGVAEIKLLLQNRQSKKRKIYH